MRERIVLIGAGSAMFTRGLVADLVRSGAEVDLALVDVDPVALEIVTKLVSRMIAARRAPITLSASVDRREALPGATVVICTIGVGGRRAWEHDVFVPRQYGIYVPVGDTVGPGGTSRALRMIPAMVAIAEDVLDLAPDALFFNYGNPMAPVCRANHKATGAPVVGLCHGVVHVADYLADALGVPPTALHYTAVGINHLTWFTEIRAGGQDALPRLQEIAAYRAAPVPGSDLGTDVANAGTAPRGGSDPAQDNPFSWELLRLSSTRFRQSLTGTSPSSFHSSSATAPITGNVWAWMPLASKRPSRMATISSPRCVRTRSHHGRWSPTILTA